MLWGYGFFGDSSRCCAVLCCAVLGGLWSSGGSGDVRMYGDGHFRAFLGERIDRERLSLTLCYVDEREASAPFFYANDEVLKCIFRVA